MSPAFFGFLHSSSKYFTCEQRKTSSIIVICHLQVEERMGSAMLGLFLFLLFLTPGCWAGDCKGHRQILRGPPGYVTDGPGNYSVNGNCEWLITGECQKKPIQINCFCTVGVQLGELAQLLKIIKAILWISFTSQMLI